MPERLKYIHLFLQWAANSQGSMYCMSSRWDTQHAVAAWLRAEKVLWVFFFNSEHQFIHMLFAFTIETEEALTL